jgi:phage repressor protein C with HTH and peptisase S24 domain
MLPALCAEKIPHPSSGFFPHDKLAELRDIPRMREDRFDEVMARIERKLDQHGFTERDASLKAVGKPDLIRDMRRRRGMPGSDRLRALARLLGTTSDWLLEGGEEGEAEIRADAAIGTVLSEVRGTGLEDVERSWRAPSPSKPVPLVGSAVGGIADGIDEHVELTELHLGEVLDYLSRPVSLVKDGAAYAVTIVGDSMAPRFEPGERAFVSPRATVGIGDDVIVQLKSPSAADQAADRVTMVLIKRLVKRTPAFVELRQFNPEMTFKVETARVAAIHRVTGRL